MAFVPEGCPLTPRQFEVLQLLGEGLNYFEISRHLGISTSTVQTHVDGMNKRLGCHTAVQAVAGAGRLGWIGWVVPTWRERLDTTPSPPSEPAPPPPPPPPPAKPVRPRNQPLVAMLAEFDRWVGSGFADQRARDSAHLAARAVCARAGVRPAGKPHHAEPLREFLQMIAAETITPTEGI